MDREGCLLTHRSLLTPRACVKPTAARILLTANYHDMKRDIAVHPATITDSAWYCQRYITFAQLIVASLQRRRGVQLPHASAVVPPSLRVSELHRSGEDEQQTAIVHNKPGTSAV